MSKPPAKPAKKAAAQKRRTTPASRRTSTTPAAKKKAPAKKAAPRKKVSSPAETPAATIVTPPQFGPRGQRLYDALANDTSPEGVKVLAEESARLADRLDEFDRIISGKGVAYLMRDLLEELLSSTDEDLHISLKVQIQGAVREARLQAGSLRQILETLGVEKSLAKPLPAGAQPAGAEPEAGGTPLDELNRKRAERQAAGKG